MMLRRGRPLGPPHGQPRLLPGGSRRALWDGRTVLLGWLHLLLLLLLHKLCAVSKNRAQCWQTVHTGHRLCIVSYNLEQRPRSYVHSDDKLCTMVTNYV